ncbi:ATP-dependent zinc metalloprotease FtsH [uncultured Ruthenibacterium sp.]|uniref:ATP-dependent zinc metalloprotease FtsH n=1 Tax=uncultured Ruthenibacterium sp. TaxID=1905347 RepID=UPI00349EAE30
MNKRRSTNGLFIIAILGLLLMFFIFTGPDSTTQTMKYSQVVDYFESGEVDDFTLDMNSGTLEITLSESATQELKEKGQSSQSTSEASGWQGIFSGSGSNQTQNTDQRAVIDYKLAGASLIVDKLDEYREIHDEKYPDNPMTYDIVPASETPFWLTMLPFIVLLILTMGAFYYFMYMQSGGGKAMNVGRAKVKDQADQGRKATFKDVAGADEEKEELQEIVEFLKNQQKFNSLGARIPHGVLLVGPPGTGKTLLARACAGEAGVPFYSISGSDFVEMYVGVGASRVRDLFDKAKKTAPCIVFIDEIDAVGRQRGTGLGGGHDEREQTLNQLLVEMDGFGANEGVIVVAATNRVDILDKALLRPGRFDRQVYVGLPDVKGREDILRVHTRNKPLAPDVVLKTIAKSTAGFTGADLENLVNEAALLAAKRGRKAITEKDIEEASIKVIAGPEKKSRVVTEKEKRLTAYHEAGHAITHYYSETADPVHEISIVPRGMAGGYTMSLPEEDKNYVTKKQMEDEIVTLLGGRVAEKLVLDDISTGASNDLERATAIARNMVMRYGFSERLGPVVYGGNPSETFLGRDLGTGRNYSEEVASEIDAEIREMLDEAFETARVQLSQHMQQLHVVAKALIEREKLSGDEFRALMQGKTLDDTQNDDPQNTEKEKAEENATFQQTREEKESPVIVVEPDTESK